MRMQSPGRAGSCGEVGRAPPLVRCRDRRGCKGQLQDGDPGAGRTLNTEAATMSSGDRRHHPKAMAVASVVRAHRRSLVAPRWKPRSAPGPRRSSPQPAPAGLRARSRWRSGCRGLARPGGDRPTPPPPPRSSEAREIGSAFAAGARQRSTADSTSARHATGRGTSGTRRPVDLVVEIVERGERQLGRVRPRTPVGFGRRQRQRLKRSAQLVQGTVQRRAPTSPEQPVADQSDGQREPHGPAGQADLRERSHLLTHRVQWLNRRSGGSRPPTR